MALYSALSLQQFLFGWLRRDTASQHLAVAWTEYVSSVEKLWLPKLRTELEPLESGKVQTGKRELGGPWIDTTQDTIRMLKEAVAHCEAMLAMLPRWRGTAIRPDWSPTKAV
jgi:hypothetical protein